MRLVVSSISFMYVYGFSNFFGVEYNVCLFKKNYDAS